MDCSGFLLQSPIVKVVQRIVPNITEVARKRLDTITSVGVSEYNGIAILPAGNTKHRTFVARVTDNKIGTWEHGRSFNKASFFFSHRNAVDNMAYLRSK